MKYLVDSQYTENGTALQITFNDGSTEIRRPDARGGIDLSDIWFLNRNTGKVEKLGGEQK